MKSTMLSLSLIAFLGVGAGCQSSIQTRGTATNAPTQTSISSTTSSDQSNPLRISVPELGFSYELSQWDLKNMPPGRVIENRLIFGDSSKKWTTGFIERIPRKNEESFLEAVQKFLQEHGYDKKSCSIAPLNSPDTANWFFTGPTLHPLAGPQEISSLGVRGNTLTDKFATTHCSPYAVRRSYFITDEKRPNATILYVNLGEDGDGILYGGPIQFLP